MPAKDYASVTIPKELADLVDEEIKKNKWRKRGIRSRAALVIYLLQRWADAEDIPVSENDEGSSQQSSPESQ